MLAVDYAYEIAYSRANRDFDMFVDGQYIGSRASYHEAQCAIDAFILDALAHGDHLTAAQLDGGDPLNSDDPWSENPCNVCGNDSDACIGTTFYCNTHEPAEAVNWSDRDDPPGTDPAPGTGLGGSDEPGDDPDDPSY